MKKTTEEQTQKPRTKNETQKDSLFKIISSIDRYFYHLPDYYYYYCELFCSLIELQTEWTSPSRGCC